MSIKTPIHVWLLRDASRLIRLHERSARVSRMFRFRGNQPALKPRFDDGVSPGGGVPAWERLVRERLMRETLAELSLTQRRFLVLREILAMPAEMVGQVAGCNGEDVRTRTERARTAYATTFAMIQGN